MDAVYTEFLDRLRHAGYAGLTPAAAVAGFDQTAGTEVIRTALASGDCAAVNHGAALVYAEVKVVPGLLKEWQSR